MKISSIETFGTHEGPGIRFVIFTQGCNFRCLYCHNPETQAYQGGKEIGTKELVEKITSNLPYYNEKGGVTVSGGEPLLQAKEITDLFCQLKKRRIHTALDTNGSVLNDHVQNLLRQTDLVLLDIKEFDDQVHQRLTGQSNTTTLKFAHYLENENIEFWVRYVFVPGYTDHPDDLNKLVSFLGPLSALKRIELLPYHTLGTEKYERLGLKYALADVETPAIESLERAQKILEKSGKEVLIR